MNSNPSQQEQILFGTVVSGGIAMGHAHLLINTNIHAPAATDFPPEPPEDGWNRIEQAMQAELLRLGKMIHRGDYASDSSAYSLFEAYQAFLLDPALHADLRDELERNGGCAEAAVRVSFRKWIRTIEQAADGQMQAKALLIADLGKMLLESLAGSRPHGELGRVTGHILVVDHLYVSDVVLLHRLRPAAIIVQHGHPASHGLILARELGVPILCQVANATGIIRSGTALVVDAARSRVIVHPALTFEAYGRPDGTPDAETGTVSQGPIEIDGSPVRVTADVGSPFAAAQAAENDADGIGLLRMEALYMQSDRPLKESEIRQRLTEILEPMAGKPVYVRLLDIGGDKPLPYVEDSLEGSSVAECRGVRLLCGHPELLQPQLQALLKLAQDHPQLHILVPMITLAEDMQFVRKALEDEAQRMELVRPPLGAMIENPAAALMINELSEWCDFVRIGSNDLTQYVMAVSRTHLSENRYFQPSHPAVLKLIGNVCRSERAGRVGLCGSLAEQKEMIPRLLKLGVREFVVPPDSVGAVRRAVLESARKREASSRSTIDPIRSDNDLNETHSGSHPGKEHIK